MNRSVILWRLAGVAASAAIVGAAIVAWRPSRDVGYVQINTVPVTAASQAALYLEAVRLAPVRNGTALLRQGVGTLTLRSEASGSNPVPLCQIEVKKDRITTITVSVLDRPPRCVCRLNAGGDTANRLCVS